MDLQNFPVSLTFIAICGMSLMPMVTAIGLYRGSINVLRGDGGDPVLFKRIRIHGNFVENAPLVALTLFGAEGLGLSAFWLWLAVASFFASRIGHYALYDRKSRGGPMTFTVFPPLALGIYILVKLWM